MIPHDLHNTLNLEHINVSAPTGATAITGFVDMKDALAVDFIIALGTLAATTIAATVLLEHADAVDDEANPASLTDGAAVPDDQLQGSEANAGFDQDDDNTVKRLGYRGSKRWLKITVTPTSNNAAMPIAILALKEPRIKANAN